MKAELRAVPHAIVPGATERVHVRRTDNARTYCGAVGESVSLAHWLQHVVPNRDGCCRLVFARLCRDCDRVIPFAMKDA